MPCARMLEDLHQGKATVALALGAFDGDAAAGEVETRGDMLSGKISFVEGAQTATHFVVLTGRPAGAAVVASGAPGLKIQVTPGLAVPPFSELTFDNTPATRLDLSPKALADIALVARLACAGRALGAAERAFELAVDNAKIRKQFGQLIGQFQAVQHKLANCLISLDGARLALEAAAEARDNDNPDWRVFAASALAFAGPALRDGVDRDAPGARRHRLRRGARGAAAFPARACRSRALRRRAGARAELADFLLGPAA